jgi:hypothetical protein
VIDGELAFPAADGRPDFYRLVQCLHLVWGFCPRRSHLFAAAKQGAAQLIQVRDVLGWPCYSFPIGDLGKGQASPAERVHDLLPPVPTREGEHHGSRTS